MMNCKETASTKTARNNQKAGNTTQAFKMPACKFCYATCGSCDFYEMYGFSSAWCNKHRRNTTSSNPACSDFQ